MSSSHPGGLVWRRSSKCDGGACVEVAELDAVIKIRDSTEPDSVPIEISRDVWQDFISWLRTGAFGAQ